MRRNEKLIAFFSLVKAVAGPLARNQAQGPLGGILKELGYTAEMVIKL